MPKTDPDLDQVAIGLHRIALAAPKGHPLSKLKILRLHDMVNASFIWFPRRESPAFYDRLMNECFRGGLKTPRIVQEAVNEATILSLVSHGLGVGFVNGTARRRCPERVVVLPVVDLKLPLPLALVWRKDNNSPLLARFIDDAALTGGESIGKTSELTQLPRTRLDPFSNLIGIPVVSAIRDVIDKGCRNWPV